MDMRANRSFIPRWLVFIGAAMSLGGVHRFQPGSRAHRRAVSRKYSTSSRMPHEGKKQAEKARALQMVGTFPNGVPRSAPIIQKRPSL
ncbi:hypothetical protein PIN31009_05558 [Pandoraea iniqua]|uniref:hypothetical protein n=1 Tax=Pandoraea iniqua TaxID=2508288 RepID=UPI001242E892|nr:hypothetical protein [Pandoraea iniqua]VVE59497.1 hypothetical protein PIN31009_05558 [Pandoraea iniqua]